MSASPKRKGVPSQEAAVLLATKLNMDLLEVRTERLATNALAHGQAESKMRQAYPLPTMEGDTEVYAYLRNEICTRCGSETETKAMLSEGKPVLCEDCAAMSQETAATQQRHHRRRKRYAYRPDDAELEQLVRTVSPW